MAGIDNGAMALRLDPPGQVHSGVPVSRVNWTQRYLHLVYNDDEGALFRCWEFYRLFVGDNCGVWLDKYEGTRSALSVAKMLVRERASGSWLEVASRERQTLVYRDLGEERLGDLVLMHGIVGRGRFARAVPFHCGAVVRPGLLIEIERINGVMVHPFRDMPKRKASPTVRTRVIGIYRPKALC